MKTDAKYYMGVDTADEDFHSVAICHINEDGLIEFDRIETVHRDDFYKRVEWLEKVFKPFKIREL